jgi:DNA modification methylase
LSHDKSGNVVPYEQGDAMIPGTGYSRSRWQIDAHGFARSSGNRLLTPADFVGSEAEAVWKLWKEHSLARVYDFEHHVASCEAREAKKELPKTFFLMPPHSWHPEVWTDVTRMRTLNGAQSAAGRELHICPMQFDIVDRAIVQYSMAGETVFDPFAGIGTVPYCAIKLKRCGFGVELNADYFRDAAFYCDAAEREAMVPSLFDLLEAEQAA